MRIKAVIFVLVFLFFGCEKCDPVGPAKPCGFPCPTSVVIPPLPDVEAAIRLGYEQARSTCPTMGSFESYPKPAIDWSACDFWARGGTCCASGATYVSEGFIRISTQDISNTLPLVTWESRNWYWIYGGCGNQAI